MEAHEMIEQSRLLDNTCQANRAPYKTIWVIFIAAALSLHLYKNMGKEIQTGCGSRQLGTVGRRGGAGNTRVPSSMELLLKAFSTMRFTNSLKLFRNQLFSHCTEQKQKEKKKQKMRKRSFLLILVCWRGWDVGGRCVATACLGVGK